MQLAQLQTRRSFLGRILDAFIGNDDGPKDIVGCWNRLVADFTTFYECLTRLKPSLEKDVNNPHTVGWETVKYADESDIALNLLKRSWKRLHKNIKESDR